jgi:arylsulfatase A-like enzyme
MEADTGFASWVRETKHAGSVDDRFTIAEAIDWIDSFNEEPFFLYLNLQNSHLPYVVPADFPRRFSPKEIGFTIRFGNIPRDKVEIAKDVYADSLAYVDAQIGRLLEHLRRRGVWDRTVVVITGDHGQAFYEHGFSAHAGEIYNEVMRVPLIIRAPDRRRGIDDRLAQHADVAPSILEVLGLPIHPSFQGRSLLTDKPDPNRSVYLVAQSPQAHQIGIVRGHHKLIYDAWQRRYLLYDLIADRSESKNLAYEKAPLVEELAKRLQTWRKLQIDYYADKALHSREYPPILAD